MKQSSLTEERVALAVRHAESGVLIAGISRRLGVTGVTCYRWQKRFAGMSIEVFQFCPYSGVLSSPGGGGAPGRN